MDEAIGRYMQSLSNRQPITRKRMLTRLAALEEERQYALSTAIEIAEVVQPHLGRFRDQYQENDVRNKGVEIFNNVATRAHRAVSAGLMSNASSPARPWFSFGTLDPELSRRHSVRTWMDLLRKTCLGIANRTGTYRALHHVYNEMPLFGTAANIVVPSVDRTLQHVPLTMGQYCIAVDNFGRPDTVYRKFRMTVGQMLQEFGAEVCSSHVKTLARRGLFDTWITIVHAIEPRVVRKYTSLDNLDMPWASIYFEEACSDDQILRESGFRYFPAICPRWSVLGLESWGYGPGVECLSDVRGLQVKEFRKAQAIDWKTHPPLQKPAEMAGREVNQAPGGETVVSDPSGAGIRPSWQVMLELRDLDNDIMQTERRINETWYADLFRMISMLSDTTQRTRAEILERSEERLLALGPVVERLTDEALEPMVDILVEAALPMMPPPPPELEGQELSIEFISPLAQAQKSIGANQIDRMIGTIRVLAEMKPDAMDKLNVDETIDVYGDMIGVDPRMIVPGNKVAMIRKARAEAQAAIQQAETMATQMGAVKDASTALTAAQQNSQMDVLGQFSGMNSPLPQGVV